MFHECNGLGHEQRSDLVFSYFSAAVIFWYFFIRKKNGQSVSDFGDHSLVAVQGAVVIVHPETKAILGGIGISGLSSQEDEDLARLGLEALGL